ncbi:MAG: metallophosphoesterase [Hyphomicrobiaceae bacterium]|nr:metallophosphoesterase [Hyphomicrobiaceae bacterium]
MTTIAHLTDVHLAPLVGLSPRYWNLKRALGYANWVRHRARAHDRAGLDLLCRDLLAQHPDHVCVSGDLTNLGLPAEHAAAARWLAHLGPPDRVSVVPGNHDIYTHIGRDPGTARWLPFMRSDAACEDLAPAAWQFPYVRRLGQVAIVGLNSAHMTPPFSAAGRLGEVQRQRLAGVLARLRAEGAFRLVMIHHPPLPGQASSARALTDAAALRDVLAQAGAELVIHGHNHRVSLERIDGPDGPVPVVGGASASLCVPHKGEALGRYNLYRIEGPPWRVSVSARGLAAPGGSIVALEHFDLGHARDGGPPQAAEAGEATGP